MLNSSVMSEGCYEMQESVTCMDKVTFQEFGSNSSSTNCRYCQLGLCPGTQAAMRERRGAPIASATSTSHLLSL